MANASVIVTGDDEKPKMSKCLLIVLGSLIFVVLVRPTDEQKEAQKKASDQQKFRMKFAQTMMGSVAESDACEKLEGDAKKACLVKIIDQIKEKMRKLRVEEDQVMDEGEKILPHLDGVLDKVSKVSEELKQNQKINADVEPNEIEKKENAERVEKKENDSKIEL